MHHIVITGGSSGLGAALARRYLARGDLVTLIARDRAKLETAKDQCRKATGREPVIVACDVTNAADMASALQAAGSASPIDILVANAGIGGHDVLAPPEGESHALAHRIFGVNTLGVVNTVVPTIAPMIARGTGHIVIVGSIASFLALPQSPAYSASKAAAHSYGHGLRRLLRSHGVRVSVVSPGFVDTPMSRSLPYPRPFLVDADRAAEIVARGIDRNRADIIFPWPLRLALVLDALLPTALTDRLIAAAGVFKRS
jgi:short-subunit dehydrogenase